MKSSTLARWLVASCLAFLATGLAKADIVKCRSPSGEISYTQTTCPDGTEPADLPEDMSRKTGSSFKTAIEPIELSPRAKELQRLPRQERARLQKQCMIPLYWNEPDCLALRETWSSERSQREMSAEARIERMRVRCEAGVTNACAPKDCGRTVKLMTGAPFVRYEGSDDDVRACSRILSFPSTAQWAQVAQSEPGEEFAARFICLPRINLPDPRGEITGWRGALVVFRSLGGGFETPPLGKQVFATVEEAATAGCAELFDFAHRVKPRNGA